MNIPVSKQGSCIVLQFKMFPLKIVIKFPQNKVQDLPQQNEKSGHRGIRFLYLE